jgi:hypothetical protein
LGALTAWAVVRAAAAAVAGERGWNAQSVRWLGIALALLIACGLASYYSHVYLEDSGDESDQQSDTTISRLSARTPGARKIHVYACASCEPRPSGSGARTGAKP